MKNPLVTRPAFISSLLVGWISVAGIAAAQLVTEDIQLQSGWNAVWLNLEPEPNDLVELLAQQAPPLDCQAVWTFDPNRDVASDTASDEPGRWFFYDKSVPSSLHTLRTLQGHRAYLIKVNVGGRIQLAGRPVIRAFSFTGRVGNILGAMSDALGGSLTFEEYFAHPSAAGKVVSAGIPLKQDIFSLTDGGMIRRSLADAIAPNQAYWINVVQDFAYAGPLDVTSSANGMSFGRSTAIRTLTINVPSSPTTRTVSLQTHPCIELSGEECTVGAAGIEWLEYREPSASPIPTWRALSDGLDIPVPAGTTKLSLELRAKRATLSAIAGIASVAGSATLPPLLIDVSDDQGSRAIIPSDVQVEPVFGLWAGKADLTIVSVHPSIQDLPLDEAVASPLGMTLILALPNPSEVAGGVIPRLLDTVTIQTFRDGRSLQRRFSSVLFDRPVSLVQEAADPVDPFGTTGTLRGTLHILPEDPLNPYRHRYNPEHRKGYEIERQITIKLESQADSLSDELAGLDGTFGPHRLTGQYTEVITGATALPITVRGTFRLERLSADAGSQ